MKKLFSILAAAVIALSFASCEKNDPGIKFFHMKVTDITDSSAVLSINPADTSAYYYVGLSYATDIDEYTTDTVVSWILQDVQSMLDNGYEWEEITPYLYNGPLGPDTVGLDMNTEFVFWAMEIKCEDGENATVGHVAFKRFRTKTIAPEETVNLGVIEAEFDDWRDDDGSFGIIGYDKDSAHYVVVYVYDEDLKGTFTYDDLDKSSSGVVTEDGDFYAVDAKLTGTYNESKQTGKLEGWLVCTNAVKYKFTANYSTAEEGGAPARKLAIKKEAAHDRQALLKQQLTLKEIRK